MDFLSFRAKLQNHFNTMVDDSKHLFVVDVDKDVLWNLYLDSFPEGTNKIFRERREHDCSCCRHFIKAVGNVVAIKDNKIITMWDFQTGDYAYQPVVEALSAYIKQRPVTDLFVTKTKTIGTDVNYEKTDINILTWNHFYIGDIPKHLVYTSSESEGAIAGAYREFRGVFKRSLEEITEDAIQTVLELISQKSLYKGEEWDGALTAFLHIHKYYHELSDDAKDNYCWVTSGNVGVAIGKIRNHSIGVLLTDISKGVELDEAVRKYEAIVAPSNYKRPKAIFTKKMLEDAQKTLQELGLLESLGRRYATIEDITVNNTIFANRTIARNLAGIDVFEELKQGIAVNPKNLSKVEELPIETFITDVIPAGITSMELLIENRHAGNMVSLIAPAMAGKTMFKWNNNFSWAYRGNMTDSMRERVKAAGGNVEGVLRFSLQWNDGEEHNPNDFDAHCVEPRNTHIYYPNKTMIHPSSGVLDVDIQCPKPGVPAVENISYSNLHLMPEGIYTFSVHNFSHRGGRTGFSAEIEFDGQIYSFVYGQELRQSESVMVAKISYSRQDGFKVVQSLPSSTTSADIWGIKTQQFQPVSIMMYSPNYWDEQNGIGHKHYFFMINGCRNTDNPNGFFNEFLHEGLMVHRRVFEALGSKMRVQDSDNQLSGVGFSSTQRNSIICKIEGHFTRTVKLVF